MAVDKMSVTSRTIVKIGILAIVFIAGTLLLWQVSPLLLIIFFGVLLAILLDASAHFLIRFLPISRKVGVITTALAALALLVSGIWQVGPSLVVQGTELANDLKSAAKSIEQWAMSINAIEEKVDETSTDLLELLPSPSGLLGGVSAVLGTTFGALANVVLILAFGIYFALEPEAYVVGAIRLLPVPRRDRVREVIGDMGLVLRHWLAGKALMMLMIGIVSYIGLSLIGVPLALLLSVIAGATSFVPIIGPAIAGGLMVLVALTDSWQLALWTIGFYVSLQAVESYLLMPVIQSKAIDLPPGVVIAAQVLFGILFGALGVVLATPLAAVSAVAIKRLYVENVLERDVVEMTEAEAVG